MGKKQQFSWKSLIDKLYSKIFGQLNSSEKKKALQIGEKIIIRRSNFFDYNNNCINFFIIDERIHIV